MHHLFMAQHLVEQRVLDRLEQISNISLEQTLGRLRAQLQDVCTDTQTDHDRVTTEIRRKLDNAQALATLIIDWEKAVDYERETLKSEGSGDNEDQYSEEIERPKLSLAIKHATLYIELGLKAQSTGNVEQAWAYAVEAAHLCGEISANSIIELNKLTIERTSKQNSNNAKGINKKTQLLKKYIASLITEHTPKNGWSTKKEAISLITSLPSTNKNHETPRTLIEDFIDTNGIKRITPSNIVNRIYNWTNEPGEVQDALRKSMHLRKPKSDSMK
ncbi:TPA: hypothetical protein ACRNCN_002649 [Pseudomonas aeruginosa]|uniref:hypothetical protein n=1 Tax=Pseudomonas aeruginosa TaxID=287 RepID=UPI003E11C781|nr:hypothetical protein [Pseudomonas aeruginosa]